ncbi:Oxygen-independent coproporphyrinogen-III oxidase 1 [Roseovarius gaetbuli]|uniref:Heme chaperone HemW n=1 Tax=Roseovarius gaetbuli TaxID=1356575 RepID=A0A1X6YWY3_9RHOB|nr:radical SAM family heme chaperone HemW [Roseovarius gaetbuli]SLN33414.1 Oxygen-independent coproporphyrinogen-III oxidase 1 [Roseovarius gaetbuli]
MAEDWQAGGFGLYIHWPFCQAKCPYCDFNSHVAREIDQSRWLWAYLSEIDRYGEMLSGRVLNSVFFGGGTPSLMNPEVVAAILDRVRRTWPAANDLEVTLEANPGSVEAGKFRAFSQGGVSRISMGVQALNDRDLKRLGRIHSVKEAQQAFDIARQTFDRVSFDLIYARQDQTLDEWRSELREALGMAIDHLSLYQLTIEQGTAFGDRYAAGRLRGLPEDDLAADMYHATQEICDAAGLGAYEVSNHAKPGSESRHNMIYWRYGDYVGIGPGAHGRITRDGQRFATEAFSSPERWLTSVEQGNAEKRAKALSAQDQATEYLLMGLRITDGIDPQRFAALSGVPLNPETVAHLQEIGMIETKANAMRATRQGRAVLNAVIRDLLPE